MLATLVVAALGTAQAGPLPTPAVTVESSPEAAAPPTAPRERRTRKTTFEVSFRGRRMTVPRRLLDSWFTDNTDKFPEWPLTDSSLGIPTERPFVNGWSYGMELLIKGDRNAAIVWVDWVDSNMPEGLWDDRDDPPDPLDGDYLVPTDNLGILMFGADFQYELPLVRLEQTKGGFGLDFHAGAGLGLGIMIGELQRWVPGENDEPAWEVYLDGDPPNSQKDVNRFWPVVDVNLGMKMNFGDVVVLRLEGGLHTMLYYGATLGFRF